MEIKQLDAEYTYDYDLDIVNIKVKQDYNYNESIDFEIGVFLDFDDNYFPVNLEILSASKRLNIEKEFLIKPDGNVNILINSDLIKLDIYFKNDLEEHVLHYINKHTDNLKIDDMETKFAKFNVYHLIFF